MKLPKQLTTVTPFSKYLAMFLFILLPIVGFYLGIQYQKNLTVKSMPVENLVEPTPSPTNTPIIPTLDTTYWKTYKNKDFSFKYPPNWEDDAKNEATDIGPYFFETGKPHLYPGQNPENNNVIMSLLVNTYDADLLWKNLHDKAINPNYTNTKYSTFNGKRVALGVNPIGVGPKGWGFFAIWYGTNNKNRVGVHVPTQYLETILSTFKFTD